MRHLSLAAVLATLGCSVSVSVDDGEATSGTGPEAGEGGAGSSSSNTGSSGTGGSAPVCDAGCLALDFARQFDNVEPYALAVDADGNILVTGGFDGTVDFGGGPLVGTGNIDAFVLKLDPVGNHLWSRRFGDLSSVVEAQVGLAIAADASGNIAIEGRFGGTTDLGGGPVTSEGARHRCRRQHVARRHLPRWHGPRLRSAHHAARGHVRRRARPERR
ncbi:hypothetical protein WME97_19070 [Sorangium sp. So ce367]|uniref:hypothetical protein n=1 Tax=Sorangium sp. So ce367 TaxID=3133305 RepID=UPI003F5E0918